MPPLLVTAAIIRCNDHILLTRRPAHTRLGGLWEFPGGKLDEGESPQQGLQREIIEELGITIRVNAIFEVAYYEYERGPVLILAYDCSRCDDRPVRNLEVSEHRWLLPSQLDDFDILPADRPIIEKLQTTDAPDRIAETPLARF